jgi:hypothetical protein
VHFHSLQSFTLLLSFIPIQLLFAGFASPEAAPPVAAVATATTGDDSSGVETASLRGGMRSFTLSRP